MKRNTKADAIDAQKSLPLAKVTTTAFAAVAIVLSSSVAAIAEPIAQLENGASGREGVSAIVYLPDVEMQELAPQEIIVAANRPVVDAVGQIFQAYQGQNIGLQGYDIKINPSTREAQINLQINHPRGVEVIQGMSSASKYALFEAIRETLLTQSIFNINEVTFTANGTRFEI